MVPLFSGSAAGGTGNFPDPGAFRTFFPIHFFTAIADRASNRFATVTGFTTHIIPFILHLEVCEKPLAVGKVVFEISRTKTKTLRLHAYLL